MEVYLSRLILNPRSRQVRRDIGNKREMHRTICKAFPAIEVDSSLPQHLRKTPRQEYKILFRLETNETRGEIELLVQSTKKPDWSFLPEDYLRNDVDAPLACKAIHKNLSSIENGAKLIFRLQANPTKRIGKSDKTADERFKPSANSKRRRRVDLRTDEERINWLMRRGDMAGFVLGKVTIKPEVKNVSSIRQGQMRVRKKQRTATFGLVVFEGVLIVTDAEKLNETLISGIGQGKAYGFGLLSVAPTA